MFHDDQHGTAVVVLATTPGAPASSTRRAAGCWSDPTRAGWPAGWRSPWLVDDRELDADLIIPSGFDRRVAPAVSRAVQETVEQTGLSRLVESE